jgi:hypothetical protein
VTEEVQLGAIAFAEHIDRRFVDLIGWKPTRKVAINADRHAGPIDEASETGELVPIESSSFSEIEADRIALALATSFDEFRSKNPTLKWCNGPYAAYTQGEAGRRYCWMGHTEKPGTPFVAVTVVTDIPEGSVVPTEEALAGLVALRSKSGYTAREIHGPLKCGRDGSLILSSDADPYPKDESLD